MKIEDHLINIRESIEVIAESIQKDIQKRQRTIAFNVSVAAAEMLEVYLHKNNLINPGTAIKHDTFNSIRKANEFLNFEFLNKEKIISLLNDIELKRNLLCYGKPNQVETIREILQSFNKIKSLFEERGLTWN